MYTSRHSKGDCWTVGISFLLAAIVPTVGLGEEKDASPLPAKPLPHRVKVPGRLKLHLQSREKPAETKTLARIVVSEAEWNVAETAIIICDMWADHPCKMAAERVDSLASRMNEVVSAARSQGVMIIHAPSGGTQYYEDTPYRQRVKQLPHAEPPLPIQGRSLDPDKEPPLPVEASDSLDACDDPEPRPDPDFDRHQHPTIKIIGYDGITSSGQEVYNLCVAEGIKNIVIMGVHTNMCVLGRPFGIRQMSYLGMNIVLARDLTDAMYDPRDPPFVSHARGTEMIIEHIETYWCPSILAEDLTRVVPGSAGPGALSASTSRRWQGCGCGWIPFLGGEQDHDSRGGFDLALQTGRSRPVADNGADTSCRDVLGVACNPGASRCSQRSDGRRLRREPGWRALGEAPAGSL